MFFTFAKGITQPRHSFEMFSSRHRAVAFPPAIADGPTVCFRIIRLLAPVVLALGLLSKARAQDLPAPEVSLSENSVETCPACPPEAIENAAAHAAGFGEFWPNLFSTDSFPARWQCGQWTAFNGWLNIVSDLLIWLVYSAIGGSLLVLVHRRHNPPFRGLVILFGIFIAACGLTHLLEALVFWWPAYRFLGLTKGITAIVSVIALVALIPAIPELLSMRYPRDLEKEIKQRRAVEEELRSSGLRYRQLVEAMTDCSWFADGAGAFVDRQPSWEAFSGQAYEEYRGIGWQTLFHPEDREIVTELWADTVRKGNFFELLARLRLDPEREFRTVEIYAVPIRRRRENGTYAVVGWFGAVVDLSEERRLYHERGRLIEALEAERLELEQLVRVVTHDLRSPLVNVQGFAQEIDRGCAELRRLLAASLSDGIPSRAIQLLECELPESADFIKHSTGRMDQLISGLRVFSKVGRAPLEPEEIPLVPFFAALEKSFQYQLRECGGTLSYRDLPTIYGDRAQLGQVFANLIDNALKYRSPERAPIIRISAEPSADGISVRVVDNGIGIPVEERKAVFVVFRRLHKVDIGGEGLGLSAVQLIVQRHGGEVEISDNSDGPGTCFRVTLPRRLADFEGNPYVVGPPLAKNREARVYV